MTHLLQLLLALALIVAAAKLSGAAANRVGQPAVFGEILAGLVLGPDGARRARLADVRPGAAGGARTGARPLIESLRDLAEIGVILLMFVAGLETDLAEMRRVGTVAFWAAFGGVICRSSAASLTAMALRPAAVLDGPLHRHDPDGNEREHLRADADGAERAALTGRAPRFSARPSSMT